jgi:hypothetical protein
MNKDYFLTIQYSNQNPIQGARWLSHPITFKTSKMRKQLFLLMKIF